MTHKNILVKTLNHYAYPVMGGLMFAAMAYFLARDGVAPFDLITLVLVAVIAFALWRFLVSSQPDEIDSVVAVRNALSNGEKPTLLEFYSEYCVGCLATKPIVDQLEREVGERMRVIRLDIAKEPGRTLVEEYGVVLTPTFIQFDQYGNKVRDSIGVIDRSRILYELEQTSG
ncbi:MAG: hypothetical protein GYB68_11575 [Chloroflexi bacterium]|nr:hypothetical protein [Chloroflexota bacterium]